MDNNRVKKRKINEISGSNKMIEVPKVQPNFIMGNSTSLSKKVVEAKETKPEGKEVKDIKECPFNPFGNSDCDMCGSWAIKNILTWV